MKALRRIVILAALFLFIVAALMMIGIVSLGAENWIARLLAAVTGFLVVGGTAWEARDASRSWQLPEPEDPPISASVIHPKPPQDDAVNKIEEAESFSRRATDKVRIEIDIEDARED